MAYVAYTCNKMFINRHCGINIQVNIGRVSAITKFFQINANANCRRIFMTRKLWKSTKPKSNRIIETESKIYLFDEIICQHIN